MIATTLSDQEQEEAMKVHSVRSSINEIIEYLDKYCICKSCETNQVDHCVSCRAVKLKAELGWLLKELK